MVFTESNVWRERQSSLATLTPSNWRFWVLVLVPLISLYAILAKYPIASILIFISSLLLFFSFKRIAPLLVILAYLPFQGVLTDTMASDMPWVAIVKDVLLLWVLGLFFCRVHRKHLYRVDPFTGGFLIFGSVCCLYVVFSPNPLRAVLEFRGLVLYPVLAIVVKNTVSSTREVKKILRTLVIVGGFTIVYGLLQYCYAFDAPYREIRADFELRATRFGGMALISTFASRPDFGVFLVSLFLLVFLVPLWKSSTVGVIARVFFLGGAMTCTFLTFSRTAWVAMVVGIVAALVLKNKKTAILGVLILAMAITWLCRSELKGASVQVKDAATDYESLSERFELWSYATRLFVSKPFGSGLGTVGGPLVYETPDGAVPIGNQMLVADNQFLKLLVEGGLPLGLAFMGLLFSILYLARKVLRKIEDPWSRNVAIWAAASWASLIASFLTIDYLGSSNSFAVYWTAVGLMGWQFSLLRIQRPSI